MADYMNLLDEEDRREQLRQQQEALMRLHGPLAPTLGPTYQESTPAFDPWTPSGPQGGSYEMPAGGLPQYTPLRPTFSPNEKSVAGPTSKYSGSLLPNYFRGGDETGKPWVDGVSPIFDITQEMLAISDQGAAQPVGSMLPPGRSLADGPGYGSGGWGGWPSMGPPSEGSAWEGILDTPVDVDPGIEHSDLGFALSSPYRDKFVGVGLTPDQQPILAEMNESERQKDILEDLGSKAYMGYLNHGVPPLVSSMGTEQRPEVGMTLTSYVPGQEGPHASTTLGTYDQYPGMMMGELLSTQPSPTMDADYSNAFFQQRLDNSLYGANIGDLSPERLSDAVITESASGTGLGTAGGPTTTGLGNTIDSVLKDYVFPITTGKDFSAYDAEQKAVEDMLSAGLLTNDQANRMKGSQVADLNSVLNAMQSVTQIPDQVLDDAKDPNRDVSLLQSIIDGSKAMGQNLLGTFGPGDTPVTAAYELMNEGVITPEQLRSSIPEMKAQNENRWVDTFAVNPNITVEGTVAQPIDWGDVYQKAGTGLYEGLLGLDTQPHMQNVGMINKLSQDDMLDRPSDWTNEQYAAALKGMDFGEQQIRGHPISPMLPLIGAALSNPYQYATESFRAAVDPTISLSDAMRMAGQQGPAGAKGSLSRLAGYDDVGDYIDAMVEKNVLGIDTSAVNPNITVEGTKAEAERRAASQIAQAAKSAGIDVGSIDPSTAAPGGYVDRRALALQITGEQDRVAAEQQEQQRIAQQQAYDAEIARAAAQAQAAQVEQAAQRASTPAGAQDIRSQIDTFTEMPAPPPVVSAPRRKPPPRKPKKKPKKKTAITQPSREAGRRAGDMTPGTMAGYSDAVSAALATLGMGGGDGPGGDGGGGAGGGGGRFH